MLNNVLALTDTAVNTISILSVKTILGLTQLYV